MACQVFYGSGDSIAIGDGQSNTQRPVWCFLSRWGRLGVGAECAENGDFQNLPAQLLLVGRQVLIHYPIE